VFWSYSDPIFGPISHLRKARIYDHEGDAPRAVEQYELFAEAWKNCEAVEKPLLDGVERDLKRLRQPAAK
jgi:hypothetical protein